MKVVKFIILFTILPIVSTSSCEKTTSPPRLTFGTVTAEMNGVPWTANINAGLINNADAILIGFENRNIVAPLFQDLIFNIPLEIRSFNSIDFESREAGALSHIVEVDAICELYELAENSDSQIELTHLDTIADKVAGKFDLTLVRDSEDGPCFSGLPDTLRFANGVFESEISRD